MESEPNDSREPSADLLMASLRANQTDVTTYFAALCDKLVDALGSRVQTSAQGGLLRKREAPHQLTVSIGEFQYTASLKDGVISCTERHVVRGIALGSTDTAFPSWLQRLVHALSVEAQRSESTRVALEHLLA